MEERLRQILAARPVQRIKDDIRELSAVLLPLYRKRGEYHLLFTKRTELVRDHKGQISFPGGVYENGDGSLENTALRECAEEIGLEAEQVRVLGRLDDIRTLISNYIISPFVAVIPWPYDFQVSSWEIEEIIEAPVTVFLNNDCMREEREIVDGTETVSYYYHYREWVIWGATARILNQFLDIYTQVVK